MSSFRSLLAAAVLLVFFVLSSASDMSIISYDKNHKSGWRRHDEVRGIYESWLAEHGKVYKSLGEKEKRFQIFKDNLRFIDRRNAENITYRLGLTPFTDLTNKEFRSMYLGAKVNPNSRKPASQRYAIRPNVTLPDSIDWRQYGVVTGVKNQGSCGSCWAFSTTAAVESINAMHTGQLIPLSEQQLVDCNSANYGCNGGFMERAFQYIIDNGGIDAEQNYPYTGQQGYCNPNANNIASIQSYENVPQYDELSLQMAVANQPISVILEGSGSDFQHYTSGIFYGYCGTRQDHAVTIVGYGSENGYDYWIVRNSWGEYWGEGGHIRLLRNVGGGGACGIAIRPSYPVK